MAVPPITLWSVLAGAVLSAFAVVAGERLSRYTLPRYAGLVVLVALCYLVADSPLVRGGAMLLGVVVGSVGAGLVTCR